MDKNTMLNILRPVFNILAPLEVDVVSQFKNAFDIKVVSEKFVGMAPSQRDKWLSDLIDTSNPKLSYEYDISFIALTPSESNGTVSGFEDDKAQPKNNKQKIASKEY